MPPKADSPAVPAQPAEAGVSGKWVIIGILTVALAAAGGSWWFRYSATHRAAEFWGSNAARLIRDAPIVELYQARLVPTSAFQSNFIRDSLQNAGGRDISHAPGLVHLRNALLEDRSYRWPGVYMRPGSWGCILIFREAPDGRSTAILITADWKYVDSPEHESMLSCEPISSGLAEVLTEFSAPGAPPR